MSNFLIGTLFFVSGLVALVYQTVWIKQLGFQFGHSAWSISTVVGVFMAGLGLGSWAAGRLARRIERPLFVYGAFEMGIALFGFLVPILLDRLSFFLEYFYGHPLPFLLARIGIAFCVLIIPTFFMGASLPVLVMRISKKDFRSSVAWLYGVNTLGAGVGVLLAGFFMLPRFGLKATNTIAILGGAMVGLLALVFGHREKKHPDIVAEEVVLEKRGPVLCLLAAFITGFLGIVLEISWSRLLSPVLGSSTYTFSLILATFLGGTAIGSFIAARPMFSSASYRRWFGLAIGVISILVFLQRPLMNFLPAFLIKMAHSVGSSISLFFLCQTAVVSSLVLLPTIGLGFVFPLLISAYKANSANGGRALGVVYAANTAGAILGAFLAGFVLLPMLGVSRVLLFLSMGGVFIGGLYLLVGTRMRRRSRVLLSSLIVFFLLGISVAVPSIDLKKLHMGYFRSVLKQGAVGEVLPNLVYIKDGISCTVAVYKSIDEVWLKVNGKTDASSHGDRSTQYMLGHLPLLMHKDPHTACIIGLGSGGTVRAVAAHPVKVVDVVELEPAMVEIVPFFSDINDNVLRDPRVQLHIDDGRTFLHHSKGKYDVIISEPSNPWIVGVGALFSAEFYGLVKERISEDGIFCQWIQSYEISRETLNTMMSTLGDAFPYVEIFVNKGDFICLASVRPLGSTWKELNAKMSVPDVAATLRRVDMKTPYDVLIGYIGSLPADASVYTSLFRNTDDNSWLEFRAPREMYQGVSMSIPVPDISDIFHRTAKVWCSDRPLREVAHGIAASVVKLRPFAVGRLENMAPIFEGLSISSALPKYVRAAKERNAMLTRNDERMGLVQKLLYRGEREEVKKILLEVAREEPGRPGMRKLFAIVGLSDGNLTSSVE